MTATTASSRPRDNTSLGLEWLTSALASAVLITNTSSYSRRNFPLVYSVELAGLAVTKDSMHELL